MRFVIFILSILTATRLAAQAPEPLDMHQVELAKPFSHRPMTKAPSDSMFLGFYTFEAPNDPASSAPFSKYQVALTEDELAVYYVRATRPFTSLDECREKAAALKRVAKHVPGMAVLKEDFSRFEARRGDEQVVVACSGKSGSPYVDLEFMRRSLSIYEQVKTRRQ